MSGFLDDLRVPVHSLPDDPDGLQYGIWAAGPDYKVRFEDGLEYFPVLGSAYPTNLPLRWRTSSVRIGDVELATEPRRAVRAGDYRYEYRYGTVIEAYDVRLDGVEQTFRIARAPASGGELVVTGVIQTELDAAVRPASREALRFHGPNGDILVDYGTATAIDTLGREFPMTTAFDGERIVLRLDANSVASARFPLLVDPLIGNDSTRECGMTSIGSIKQPVTIRPLQPTVFHPNGLAVYTRISSASDHDAFAGLVRPGMQFTALVWADVATHHTPEVAVGGLDASRRLVLASERRVGSTTHLSIYSQDPTLTGFMSGVSYLETAANGENFRNPDVGGALTGEMALIVYDYNAAGSSSNRIRGMRFNAVNYTRAFLAADIAAASTTNHERNPAVTPTGPDWLVAFTESNTATGRIFGRKVLTNGLVQIGLETLQPPTNHIFHDPRVAGLDGRYLMTWQQAPAPGTLGSSSVQSRRFNWPDGSGVTLGLQRTLHSGLIGYRNGEVAHDFNTRSHWIATYDRSNGGLGRIVEAARIGYSGGVIDSTSMHPGSQGDQPFAASVAFSQSTGEDRFDVLYATQNTPSNSVLGESYSYPAVCYDHPTYGIGCGTFDVESFDPSIAGSQFFTVRLDRHFGGVAVCLLSQLQGSLPLDVIQMFGCTMLVEPALTISVPGSLVSGSFQVSFSLPDNPLFTGFLNSQWVYFEPGANSLNLVANAGRVHEVR